MIYQVIQTIQHTVDYVINTTILNNYWYFALTIYFGISFDHLQGKILQHEVQSLRTMYCGILCTVGSYVLWDPMSCGILCPVGSYVLCDPMSCGILCTVGSYVLWDPMFCGSYVLWDPMYCGILYPVRSYVILCTVGSYVLWDPMYCGIPFYLQIVRQNNY
jgi:predicted aconitase with swiveling domain